MVPWTKEPMVEFGPTRLPTALCSFSDNKHPQLGGSVPSLLLSQSKILVLHHIHRTSIYLFLCQNHWKEPLQHHAPTDSSLAVDCIASNAPFLLPEIGFVEYFETIFLICLGSAGVVDWIEQPRHVNTLGKVSRHLERPRAKKQRPKRPAKKKSWADFTVPCRRFHHSEKNRTEKKKV